MSDHPIAKGRRVALKDESLWKPLKGVVALMRVQFSLDVEVASKIIADGLSTGTVGHKPANPKDMFWVVSPRAAELVKMGGSSYESHIDWREGSLDRGDAAAIPLLIFWPDVESAVEAWRRMPAASNPRGVATKPSKRGPKGNLTRLAANAMLLDLKNGKQTADTLSNQKQELLASIYNVGSRYTAVKARDMALSEFAGVSNSDN